MAKPIIYILLILPIMSLYGQSDTTLNRSYYKWPYWDEAPRYIAIYGGFSGRNLEFKEIGINISLPKNSVATSISMTPMLGPQLTYRSSPEFQALTAGLFMKGGILLGLDYQYRWNEHIKVSAIRPAVGLHLFRFDFEYGFNIYLKKLNNRLPYGDFRIGLTIPIINLSKNL